VSSRTRHRTHIGPAVIIGVVLLVVALTGPLKGGIQLLEPPTPSPSSEQIVEFEGAWDPAGKFADIQFGSASAFPTLDQATSPWHAGPYPYDNKSTVFVFVSPRGQANKVMCRILINGHEVKQQYTAGGIAKCRYQPGG
jgi:hypothetical protein